jgi:hypothetical protein
MSSPQKRQASAHYLPQLNHAVSQVIAEPRIHSLIDTLKGKLNQTSEAFVWSTIDLQTIPVQLPEQIRSCWFFVLRRDMPSGCHYHPNSIQHMVVIEGEGTSRVGSIAREMRQFVETDCSLEDTWYVIDAGVPHEFFPRAMDMVVISFHTCDSDELEEISCDSGATRLYESGSTGLLK